MRDFIFFDHLIARDILLIFYYLGAVVVSVSIFSVARASICGNSFLSGLFAVPGDLSGRISLLRRIFALVLTLLFLFFMELGWRLLFEMMIAYFDMHDYLARIAGSL